MNDGEKILFVCVENARRSQMAEAIFNELARRQGLTIQAISAGTQPGEKVDPNIVTALEEIGITIRNSIPKSLTKEMIHSASRIISMGCLTNDSCPSLLIDVAQDWNIEDPKGKSMEKVREIRDLIKENVEDLICQLSSH